MTGPAPLWLTEAEVVGLIHLGEAIDALEVGLREEAAGRALTMSKTHATWAEGSTLHAVGAVFEGLGWFGAKAWGHTPGGATPLFLLWEADSGKLAAVIEAFALGQMRTGGISGVATRWASDPDADTLAVIGSGKQALTQVASVALVRPLKEVRVFSPTPANRSAFATLIRSKGFDFAVTETASVREAVRDAPVVTTVTRARVPFLAAADVARGAHINAVGAITPERREIAPDILARAGLITVDDPSAARRLAVEFTDAFAGSEDGWSRLVALSQIVDRSGHDRSSGDLSVFKAMGMGLSDLSLAVEILQRARHNGIGRAFDHPTRVAPRLRP